MIRDKRRWAIAQYASDSEIRGMPVAAYGIDLRRAQLAPIEWIWTSPALREYILGGQRRPEPILVADFGPGENEEVPMFFAKTFNDLANVRTIVYCVDAHQLRLESLMNTLQENGIANLSRMVLTKIEAMRSHAVFLAPQRVWLAESKQDQTDIDRTILTESRVPSGAFGLGILNNDLLGYLKEYYRMEDKLERCVQEIHAVMAPNSLLVVTQPGMLHPMDNVAVLEPHGFAFVEEIDVDLAVNSIKVTSDRSNVATKTRMNHYRAIVFALHG